jgi:rubredoxin
MTGMKITNIVLISEQNSTYIKLVTLWHRKCHWCGHEFRSKHGAAAHWNCLLTPWSRVLPENLRDSRLVKQYPAFCGTRRFITAFTRARPVPILSQINPVHVAHPTSRKFTLILSTHLSIGLSKWSLSLRFTHQNPACTSPRPHACYMPFPSQFYLIN